MRDSNIFHPEEQNVPSLFTTDLYFILVHQASIRRVMFMCMSIIETSLDSPGLDRLDMLDVESLNPSRI